MAARGVCGTCWTRRDYTHASGRGIRGRAFCSTCKQQLVFEPRIPSLLVFPWGKEMLAQDEQYVERVAWLCGREDGYWLDPPRQTWDMPGRAVAYREGYAEGQRLRELDLAQGQARRDELLVRSHARMVART